MADKEYSLKELNESLKEKQKIFCQFYVVDWNITQAYKKAYLIEDDNSAAASGHKLLSNTKIKQYIAFIKNDYEFLCGISKAKQLNEIQKIAYSSISHLHNTWIELHEWEDIKENNPDALDAIESIDTKTDWRTNDNNQETEVNYIKLKLYSKNQALEMINKMMGYNEAEKLDLRSKGKEIKLFGFGDK